jgi:hypothetical protein
MALPTLKFDGSKAPILKITVTATDPADSRAYAGGDWALKLLAGPEVSIHYDGGVLPFYGYTDTSGRKWTKDSDDGMVAVFTTTV